MDPPSKTWPAPQVCIDDNGIDNRGLCHVFAQILHFALHCIASITCLPCTSFRPSSTRELAAVRWHAARWLLVLSNLANDTLSFLLLVSHWTVGLIDQLSVLFLEGNLKKMSTYPICVGDRSHLPKPTSQFRASIRTEYYSSRLRLQGLNWTLWHIVFVLSSSSRTLFPVDGALVFLLRTFPRTINLKTWSSLRTLPPMIPCALVVSLHSYLVALGKKRLPD